LKNAKATSRRLDSERITLASQKYHDHSSFLQRVSSVLHVTVPLREPFWSVKVALIALNAMREMPRIGIPIFRELEMNS
jgi:hypothetical protein